mmetsp:Transcript_26310/g.39001  ORF Transcript_26310/g.39001 Transcript_26310/m.39001 type:complete len:109 (+) Transcript_26310:160-486(+)
MSKSTSETSDPVYVTATPVSNTSSQYENSGTSSNTDTGESVPHAYPTAQVEESRVGGKYRNVDVVELVSDKYTQCVVGVVGNLQGPQEYIVHKHNTTGVISVTGGVHF